jgi:SOS-response transcriptional repressor LexA
MRQNQDARHLAKLQDHYARHGVLPSYAGISDLVGFRAKNAAVKLVSRLLKVGYLRIAPNGRLAPDHKFFDRPFLASVPASRPDTLEMSLETMSIDRYLIDRPSRTALVKVKGESMKDAGIYDGDVVVVECRESASAGEFVVARVDGEYTLKELDFEGKRPVLRPHNSAFPVLRPMRIEIVGIVRGVARRYGARRQRQEK